MLSGQAKLFITRVSETTLENKKYKGFIIHCLQCYDAVGWASGG